MTKDDSTPATRADVRRLEDNMSVLKSDVSVLKSDVGVLKSDVSVLRSDVNDLRQELDHKFQYVNDGINKVLSVLSTIEERLTEKTENHEERITRLEQHAGIGA